jgi:DNA replication protein DnaC
MSEAVEAELPQNDVVPTGVYNLGPSNRSSLKRLANIAQGIIDNKQEIPRSPFAEFVAKRITGQDRQDFSMLLSGKKGSGKSYSSLYIACRVADEIVRIRGGKREDYFTLKNAALLEDVEGIRTILERSEKYQILLIDDSSVSVNSREFQSRSSKNFNRIFTTCRTNRWFLILNAPVRTHTDLTVRELVDVVASVYKSFHGGGFNILKIKSIELSESNKNKQYGRRLSFDGEKIDFWCAFKPPAEMAEEYDKLREAAGKRIITDQAPAPAKSNLSLAERNFRKMVERHADKIRSEIIMDPSISISTLSGKIGLDRGNIRKIIIHERIPRPGAQR